MDTKNIKKKPLQKGCGHNPLQSDLEVDGFEGDDNEDVKETVDRTLYAIQNDEADEDSITEMKFPGSTYTLLFTSPIISIPFIFASMSTLLCYICLLLSLFNLFSESSPDNLFGVPAGVKPEVRGAQYVGVLVSVLMEEEVPDAIQLFRTFTKESLYSNVPKLSYKRFLFSCICRIINGYLYLLSVFLVIVQADNVLDIFYDLLALQFVQSIDDVSFNLARKEMFGATLFAATNHDHMIQQSTRKNSCLRRNFLLKSILLINLALMYVGLIYVTLQQRSGAYVCPSISVNFGDEVWEEALILGYESPRFLEYSYFNGIYKVEGNFNGRPRYVEKNKWNGGEFATTVGAEIIFCKESGRWVFTHEDIYKHVSVKIKGEDGCGWLIQSDISVEYDLANIQTKWMFWTGSVTMGAKNVEIVCNKCQDESDCNYQGICLDKGLCLCDLRQESFGSRCELHTACNSIYDDYQNRYDLAVNDGVTYMSYERNIYFQTFRSPNNILTNFPSFGRRNTETGENFFTNNMNGTSIALVYSGSRWFGVEESSSVAVFSKFNEDFHAFWMDFFSTKSMLVSEPTSRSSPIGVDFSRIISGDDGKEYGPYGRLEPLALYEGDGFFHCIGG